MTAIDVSGLTKAYDATTVLDGVDLVVRRGGVCALLGPNGAGKTTTVRILATLARADSGVARVAGLDVVRDRRAVRRRIGLTGQYAAVDALQTGEENLAMMGRLAGLGRRAAQRRARELVERFDLAHVARKRAATYSGGTRRRLDLAAGLVRPPEVLFLDEPTTGLDPRSRQTLWDVVAELARSGITILLTTQYLEEADRLADQVAVMDNGRIVAEGTPEELKRRVTGTRLDLMATSDAALARLETLLAGRVVRRDLDARTLGVATDGSAAHLRTLLDAVDPAGELVAQVHLHTATLDEVFMTLTGHEAKDGVRV